MEISLKSSFYLGANIIIGGLSIYHNPHRYQWLTGFVIGLLAGTFRCNFEHEDNVATYLIHNTMPGFLTTAINLLALAVINKKVDSLEPYASQYSPYISGLPGFIFGYKLAHVFALDMLKRTNHNPHVARWLDDVVL